MSSKTVAGSANLTAHAASPVVHVNQAASAIATPRSIPSPAVSRSNVAAAKTPASLQGATPVRSAYSDAPMVSSLSQMSGFSTTSPAGLGTAGLGIGGMTPMPSGSASQLNSLINFASPATFAAMDIGTPSLLDPTAALGGQPMNMTLSELGITPRSQRNDGEDRRNKMSIILGKLLKGSSGIGRISDEGVRRVGTCAGFDVEVEAKYQSREFEGTRPVVIAGRNAILIDVNLQQNVVQNVQVSFSSERPAVTSHQAAAAQVLLDDLTPARGIASINTKLDKFAANLEILARLDKLSSPQFNCVEAMTSIYTSLTRLYEHEKDAARMLFQEDDRIQRHVLDKKCGKPLMHAANRIGLTLDYLVDRPRSAQSQVEKHPEGNAMQIDLPTHRGPSNDKMFALELTLIANHGQLHGSARNAAEWLSENVIKPFDDGGEPLIDWLDPLTTMDVDSMDMNVENPRPIFVAKCHPPLLLPSVIAAQVLQTVNSQIMPMYGHPRSYISVLNGTEVSVLDSRIDLVARATRPVFVPGEHTIEHQISIYDNKPEASMRLDEIPFDHPRQIIELLPIMRQWALLETLLAGTLGKAESRLQSHKTDSVTPDVTLDDLILDDQATSSAGSLPIDIVLACGPSPSLTLCFPMSTSRVPARVTLTILPNAEISIIKQNLVEMTAGEKNEQTQDGQKRIERMAKALEICWDLSVWIEWVRQKF